MTPHEVLDGLLRSDPTRPRVTCYDDGTGERIELSGKVLANWVAKAANLLQEEFEISPGHRVRLRLPVDHWRTTYWALAAWSVGAHVVTDDGDADDLLVTVTPDPAAGDQIVVTLAALARAATIDLPVGAVDEARELATYADVFVPYQSPTPDHPALDGRSYADLVTPSPGMGLRTWVREQGLDGMLRQCLSVWAADGSVLLLRGTSEGDVAHRLETEGAVPAP